jgi:hypothetical protein
MILDKRTEFCDATALDTTGTDTDLIGNVIDLGTTSRDVGNGEPLYLVIQVDTAADSLGEATVQFHLASDAQEAIATDGSATYHWSSAAIGKATLIAGYQVCVIALPGGTYERYLGILTTTGTAALTAGKVNAFLTKDPHGWTAYAAAI